MNFLLPLLVGGPDINLCDSVVSKPNFIFFYANSKKNDKINPTLFGGKSHLVVNKHDNVIAKHE